MNNPDVITKKLDKKIDIANNVVKNISSSKIFSVNISKQAIFDAIMFERSTRRYPTHKTKTRGEVRGGGRKPFAQKGTGKARAGSIRSPIWVGGGTVFGPSQNKNYRLKINKKVRKLAFFSALKLKLNAKAILVKEIKMDKISTKDCNKKILNLKIKKEFRKILIVSECVNLFKSSANIPHFKVLKLSNLMVETILDFDFMIISQKDIQKLESRF